MTDIVVERRDHAAEHKASIARLRKDLAKYEDQAASGAEGAWEEMASLVRGQITFLEQATPANPAYHESVDLRCEGKGCGRAFTASFPEHQRAVICPSCHREVLIPSEKRGMP